MTPWRRAWQEALYGAAGFYRDPAGPAGHFATSSHGPAGRIFAQALVALAARANCAAIVDMGAGRGELLRHLHALAPDLALGGVDIVRRPTDLEQDIAWVESAGGPDAPLLPAARGRVLVVANEWLDVVPCPIGEVDPAGRLREVEVDETGQERLGAVAGQSATFGPAEMDWVERWWPYADDPGSRVEVGLPRDRALAELISQFDDGVVVAIDYGHRVGERPRAGTLVGYRGGRVVAPVPNGSCDLTAHVSVDSLPHDILLTQRAALGDLLPAGDRPTYDQARRDPAVYLAALQENSARAELTGPGLGDFWWAVSARNNG